MTERAHPPTAASRTGTVIDRADAAEVEEAARAQARAAAEAVRADADLTLADVLDRVLDRGVVLCGDVTLTVAGIDLVHLSLRALLISAHRADELGVVGSSSTRAVDEGPRRW